MKCNIKVLSPVHIGSGERYTASEYVNSKAKTKKGTVLKTINRIDISKYFLSLDDNKKDDFLSNLSETNFNLKSFDSKIPNIYRKYQAINKSKNEIGIKQEINEAIKTLNELYIPGSSLKGAIKSAVLYNALDDEMIEEISRNVINHKGRVDNKKYTNFMNNIFTSDKKYPAPQRDIMKFLQVSDSTTIKTPTVYDVATVMASYNKGNNEFYSRNKRTHEPTLSFLETIAKNKKLSFNINNNYDYEVFKRLGLDDKKHLIDLDNIKKSIFIFSKNLIDYELEFADNYNISYLLKFYKNIKKMNTLDTPVLRVGAGSGFLSTTVGLKIKEYDKSLFDNIRDGTRGKTYDYSFPKSRKITMTGGNPLGWIQLFFEEN